MSDKRIGELLEGRRRAADGLADAEAALVAERDALMDKMGSTTDMELRRKMMRALYPEMTERREAEGLVQACSWEVLVRDVRTAVQTRDAALRDAERAKEPPTVRTDDAVASVQALLGQVESLTVARQVEQKLLFDRQLEIDRLKGIVSGKERAITQWRTLDNARNRAHAKKAKAWEARVDGLKVELEVYRTAERGRAMGERKGGPWHAEMDEALGGEGLTWSGLVDMAKGQRAAWRSALEQAKMAEEKLGHVRGLLYEDRDTLVRVRRERDGLKDAMHRCRNSHGTEPSTLDIGAMAARIGELEGVASDLHHRVDEVERPGRKDWLKAAGTRPSTMLERVDALGERMGKVESRSEANSLREGGLCTRVYDLEKQTMGLVKGARDAFKEHERMGARVGEVEDGLQRRCKDLALVINEVHSRTGVAEGDVRDLQRESRKAFQAFDKLRGRVNDLSVTVQDTGHRTTELESAAEVARGNHMHMDGRGNLLEGQVKGLQELANAASRARNALKARVSNVEEYIVELQDNAHSPDDNDRLAGKVVMLDTDVVAMRAWVAKVEERVHDIESHLDAETELAGEGE